MYEEIEHISDWHAMWIREWIRQEDAIAQANSDRLLASRLKPHTGTLASPEDMLKHLETLDPYED